MIAGLLIEIVDPDGPAEAAGLRGGAMEIAVDGAGLLVGDDIVTHINGNRIDDMEALVSTLRPLQVGDSVELEVFRLGQRGRIGYRLPERPFLPGDMPGRAMLPMTAPPP